MKSTLDVGETDQSTIRLVVVTRHRLDGDALAALFHAHADFRVVCTATSLKPAAVVCRHRRPNIVVLDAELASREADHSITSFQRQIGEIPILLLDDELNNARLITVLETPFLGYFTRCSQFGELAEGVRQLVRGERAFSPTVRRRIHHTPNGWQFRHDQPPSPLACLTAREIEVLRLVALGNTVKDCAEILDLSPSTVDNHKARLMKKLGVHKALDLTRLAIREGLIRL